MASATKVRRSNSSKCKQLPEDVKKAIRSDYTISSVTRCIEELVFNSIDAGATDIQIDVDLTAFKIKVQDNGNGLSSKDLEKIGTRYMTSKIKSREDFLKNDRPEFYGYRGESLASIIEMSDKVEILTKQDDGGEDFMMNRKFCDGKSRPLQLKENKFRTSGFLVYLTNFLGRQPVRQKRINASLQMEEVKATIQMLSLIHHNILFTIRDMNTCGVILRCQKTNEPTQEFANMCRSKTLPGATFTVLDLNAQSLGYHINVTFCTQGSKQRNVQYLFVNKRPVNNSRLCKLLSNSFGELLGFGSRKNRSGLSGGDDSQWQRGKESGAHHGNDVHPMFIAKISCPISEYSLVMEGNKYRVEFDNKHNIDGALDVAAATARTVMANFNAGRMDQKWKPLNSLNTKGKWSQVSGEEVLKQIKSKASISDMKSALVSQPAYRVQPAESYTHRGTSTKTKDKVNPPSESDSDSSVNVVYCSQDLSEPSVSQGRLSVLKPISSYANATATRHLPKKGPFGKIRERMIDTAGLRKRKMLKESSLHESKKQKLSGQPSIDGIEAWNLARTNARKNLSKAARGRATSSSSPEERRPIPERTTEMDSDSESIISHTLSRLSMTPRDTGAKCETVIPEQRVRSINLIDELKNSSRQKQRSMNISDAETTSRSKIQAAVKKDSKAQNEINFQIQTLCGNSSTSNRNYQLGPVSETPSIYHQYSRNAQQSSQNLASHNVSKPFGDEQHDSSDEMAVIFAGSSQKSRMSVSDITGQNFPEGYSNANDVRQRDPRVRARHAETKHKRNAMVFSSQEASFFGPNLGLRNSQQMEMDLFHHESQLQSSSQTNRYHRSSQELRSQVDSNFQTRENVCPLPTVPENLYVGHAMDYLKNQNSHGFDLNNPGYSAVAVPCDDGFLPLSPSDGEKNLFDMDYSESKEHVRNSSNFFDLFADGVMSPICNTDFKELKTSSYFENKKCEAGLDEMQSIPQLPVKTPGIGSDQSELWSPVAEMPLSDHSGSKNDLNKENIVEKLGNGTSSSEPLQRTKKFRNEWLKKTFPETCSAYWNVEEARTTSVDRFGDLNKVISDPKSLIGNTLNACLRRVHEDDAGVKWRNGLPEDNNDVNSIAQTMRVPPVAQAPIQVVKKCENSFEQKKFDATQLTWRLKKEELKKIVLIGNADKKFILAKVLTQNEDSYSTIIVMFDQHAVHERIRLERLIADIYDTYGEADFDRCLKSRDLMEKITMEYPESDISVMSNFNREFRKNGLYFEVLNAKQIQLARIPVCFDYRLTEPTAVQEAVMCDHYVRMLVQEIVQDIIIANGARPDTLPKTIMDELKSQACRGAIKFGDELSLEESSTLLEDLQKCNMPFQCAHGRPTLYPMLELID